MPNKGINISKRPEEMRTKNTIKPPKRIQSDPLWFRRNTIPDSHSLEIRVAYTLKDKFETVKNRLIPGYLPQPTLILKDNLGQDRFILSYRTNKKIIIIDNIQRVRSQYDFDGQNYVWNSEKEKIASNEFAKTLGLHPSEFLVCEFLSQAKNLIKLGFKINLLYDPKDERSAKNYAPIIERFFNKSGVPTMFGRLHNLALNKERVAKIIGD